MLWCLSSAGRLVAMAFPSTALLTPAFHCIGPLALETLQENHPHSEETPVSNPCGDMKPGALTVLSVKGLH